MNIFVFDIETVPDVAAGRRLYELDGLDDKDVGRVMFHKRAEETGGSEFLRHHLHRIVAISVVLRTPDRFKVWTLGDTDAPEQELLQRFFDGIDRFMPTLVSWNGGRFDLPDHLLPNCWANKSSGTTDAGWRDWSSGRPLPRPWRLVWQAPQDREVGPTTIDSTPLMFLPSTSSEAESTPGKLLFWSGTSNVPSL